MTSASQEKKAGTPKDDRPAPDPLRRPTINDVARLASVSKKTVSRVINLSPFVRDETRELVQSVIADLGYSPDPQARDWLSAAASSLALSITTPIPNIL